jgi:formylglycine-generating enzyme required for sulfatase activity
MPLQAVGTLGHEGGQLELDVDGLAEPIRLQVPADALDREVRFEVRPINIEWELPDGLQAVEQSFEIEPNGISFRGPATLYIPTADHPAERTFAVTRDAQGQLEVLEPVARRDGRTGFFLQHLSPFSLVVVDFAELLQPEQYVVPGFSAPEDHFRFANVGYRDAPTGMCTGFALASQWLSEHRPQTAHSIFCEAYPDEGFVSAAETVEKCTLGLDYVYVAFEHYKNSWLGVAWNLISLGEHLTPQAWRTNWLKTVLQLGARPRVVTLFNDPALVVAAGQRFNELVALMRPIGSPPLYQSALHAVLAYGYDGSDILIYDSNYPGQTQRLEFGAQGALNRYVGVFDIAAGFPTSLSDSVDLSALDDVFEAEFCRDEDGDGEISLECGGVDCSQDRRLVPELCNELDDDCDAVVDEGTGACAPEPPPGWVRIEAGGFTMGSPLNEPGHRDWEVQHEVSLTRALLVSETEFTAGEYHHLFGVWREFGGPEPEGCGADCPARSLSWWNAVGIANARSDADGLPRCYRIDGPVGPCHEGGACPRVRMIDGLDCIGYRLPTEGEWEYFARAGTETPFWSGGLVGDGICREPSLDDVDRICVAGDAAPYGAVRSLQANPWGLYDVHGNVTEWVWDVYGDYAEGPVVDPTGASGIGGGGDRNERRVYRGGCVATSASDARSANRAAFFANAWSGCWGMRLVRTAPGGPLVDADGDGFPSLASGGSDCDDADRDIYPCARDVAGDGRDADCDGRDLDSCNCGACDNE